MSRFSWSQVVGRLLGIIFGLLGVGLLLRLLMAILAPVLPPQLTAAISAGWQMLYGMAAPALPAMFALGIALVIGYIVVGKR
jgi:hypothetical protein